MAYLILTIIGGLGGAFCVFIALESKRLKLGETERELRGKDATLHAKITENAHYRGQLDAFASQMQSERQQFDSQVISYREIQNENVTLKRDLRNFYVHVRKLQLDQITS